MVTMGVTGQMGRSLSPACAGYATAYIISSSKNCHKRESTGFAMGILCFRLDTDISHLSIHTTLPCVKKIYVQCCHQPSVILSMIGIVWEEGQHQ